MYQVLAEIPGLLFGVHRKSSRKTLRMDLKIATNKLKQCQWLFYFGNVVKIVLILTKLTDARARIYRVSVRLMCLTGWLRSFLNFQGGVEGKKNDLLELAKFLTAKTPSKPRWILFKFVDWVMLMICCIFVLQNMYSMSISSRLPRWNSKNGLL